MSRRAFVRRGVVLIAFCGALALAALAILGGQVSAVGAADSSVAPSSGPPASGPSDTIPSDSTPPDSTPPDSTSVVASSSASSTSTAPGSASSSVGAVSSTVIVDKACPGIGFVASSFICPAVISSTATDRFCPDGRSVPANSSCLGGNGVLSDTGARTQRLMLTGALLCVLGVVVLMVARVRLARRHH